MDRQKQFIHLYQRAGFGLTPAQLGKLTTLSKAISSLLAPEGGFRMTSSVQLPKNWSSMSKNQRRQLADKARKEQLALGGKWIEHLSTTNDVLLEKITLFWHGHFACSANNRPDYSVKLNNTMRRLALGNFRTLTKAVAREAAMLDFLNNTQNKKFSPNENFARELMELFTIGRDQYSETDIKEAARAFTGWSHLPDGTFILRRGWHDFGRKTFFGQTGNFEGDDIIDILCDDKRTAMFIASKLYLFFVADVADAAAIEKIADVLYEQDYELKPTLEFLFTANWFYAAAGTKIKSPIELIVGLNRSFNLTYQDPKTLLFFQHALGQHLFRPPNVAGWPGGRKWIDSSTLAFRMRLPSILLNGGVIEWNLLRETDTMVAMKSEMRRHAGAAVRDRLKVTVDWDSMNSTWGAVSPAFFTTMHLPENRSSMANDMITATRKDVKSLATTILSLPEFQLC